MLLCATFVFKMGYTNENRQVIYTNPLTSKLFISHSFKLGEHKSEIGRVIFKKFFDSFSEPYKKELLKLYDSMTHEQRQKPWNNE